MLSPREQLAELDALIAAHVANISHVREVLNNPQLSDRLIAERRATIDRLLHSIAELSSMSVYGDEMIARSKARIAELKSRRAALANSEAIQKLLDLQEKMDAIEAEDLDISAMVMEIEDDT